MERSQRRDEMLEILTEWTAPIFGVIPVWISVPIALLGWVVIYFYWTMKVSSATPVNQFGLILGAVFAGATLSAGYRGWQFRRNRERFVADRLNSSVLSQLSDDHFKRLVANLYREEGQVLEELEDNAPERGFDLTLHYDGQKTIVHYCLGKDCKVGVQKVRELFGIQAHEEAVKSVLITRGIFTEQARKFATGKPMELIDGAKLANLADRLHLHLQTADTAN